MKALLHWNPTHEGKMPETSRQISSLVSIALCCRKGNGFACKEQATDAKYDSKEGAAAESIESAESDKKVAESYDPDS